MESTFYREWTQDAIACYERECVCDGCYYYDFFAAAPYDCQMASTVRKLVKVIGAPPSFSDKLSSFQREVINLFMQEEKLLSARYVANKLNATKRKADHCIKTLLEKAILILKPKGIGNNYLYKLCLDIEGNIVDYGDEISQEVIELINDSQTGKHKVKPKKNQHINWEKHASKANLKKAINVEDLDKKEERRAKHLKTKVTEPIKPKEIKTMQEENKVQLPKMSIMLLNVLGNKTMSRQELASELNMKLQKVCGILFWLIKKNIVKKIDDNAYRLSNKDLEWVEAPEPPKKETERTKKEKKEISRPDEQTPLENEQKPAIGEPKPTKIEQELLIDELKFAKQFAEHGLVLDNRAIIELLGRVLDIIEKLVA